MCIDFDVRPTSGTSSVCFSCLLFLRQSPFVLQGLGSNGTSVSCICLCVAVLASMPCSFMGILHIGSIKRWNHHRGLMTHGSKSKRQHGSIGMSATPSRVLPGLKMAGHMGAERVKIRKLEVQLPVVWSIAVLHHHCCPMHASASSLLIWLWASVPGLFLLSA